MVTGTYIYEYFKCKRQLHLNMNRVDFYSSSENIKIGKLIEESTYKRRSNKYKQYNIGVGVLDYIDVKNKTIYETKKSKSHIELAIWQIKYYLFILGDGWKGILEVPTSRFKKEICLSMDDKIELENAIKYIENIDVNTIPSISSKKYCRGCSFNTYCYV